MSVAKIYFLLARIFQTAPLNQGCDSLMHGPRFQVRKQTQEPTRSSSNLSGTCICKIHLVTVGIGITFCVINMQLSVPCVPFHYKVLQLQFNNCTHILENQYIWALAYVGIAKILRFNFLYFQISHLLCTVEPPLPGPLLSRTVQIGHVASGILIVRLDQ